MQHDSEFRHRSVGEVVAEDYRRAAVFHRFGIDFCCKGRRTIESACDGAGVAVETLEREVLAVDDATPGHALPGDPRTWETDFLTDYLVNIHHRYVRETLPVLRRFSGKVARVHGGDRPELVEIGTLVEALDRELGPHLEEEERVVFPRIRALAGVANREERAAHPLDREGTVEVLRAMEGDHERTGALMARIRELSDRFTPPEGACATYRATYAKLEEFEGDLHRHVHLENNILFPRALDLAEREVPG